MARPTKQGVDYFPLDVHLDNKFKFIEIKYGLKGFGVVVKMMQNIYSQGYWAAWGEDEQLLFASEIKVDFGEIEQITEECIKRDIFDKGLFEKFGILTSQGIQKRYKEIVRRRKDVNLTVDYLLIDGNFGVNDDINPTLSKHDAGKSTQSKGKESKVNKTKGNNEPAAVENPFKFYQENFGVLSSFMGEDIGQWIDDLNEALVIAAMKIALQNGKPWKYATGILKDWQRRNIKTLHDVAADSKQRNGSKKQDEGSFDLND